ncbi:conjugative transposon protein TraM [Mucilaginibacter sp. SP1R1]|uniref:conjugative transposon protein TraM n=1 Tax=Mucilaginibacter sp. SP1R1 TaxID=2723091 RepID=UPI00161C2E7E|nr:conjugative transposon protein TraM [Mucilaginibacter sp. SP1R1]MBB6150703.1 hypothetical protein [Mucilaginibacter sp. SP1R1]
MKQQTLTPKQRRQRKSLLVFPMIVSAFTTLLFWALGGGDKVRPAEAALTPSNGLNTTLPDAKLKNEHGLNKMSYYDKATSDSVRLKQQMKTDPYYHPKADSGIHFPIRSSRKFRQIGSVAPTANADLVYQKLAQLQTTINKPLPTAKTVSTVTNDEISGKQLHPGQSKEEDPELQQMNSLMEKILDIQHPERLMEKIGSPTKSADMVRFKAIPAVIDGKQKITQGTVVCLRLLDTVTINGQLIPKGQLLYGSGELYNQRLTMTIKIIRMGINILPVDLTVFDMTDGLEGICVPEAITGDAVRDGAASGVQGLEFMSLDPSVSTQLAGAGINAAKGLFSKKVKRIKAKLKDGHALLLRDNNKWKQLNNQK